MKKLASIILSLALVWGLVGCSQNDQNGQNSKTDMGNTSGEKTEIKIAFSVDSLSEGTTAQANGMKAAAEAFNAENDEYYITVNVFNADKDVSKQLADVETIIVDNYDVLVFSCVDSVGSIPALQAAHEAGMIVIDVRDMGQPDLVTLTMNFTNEEMIADMCREWLQAKLDADPELVLKVGLIYGTATQTMQLSRGDFAKEWEQEEDRVQVVASAYCDWDTQKAQSTTEDWIQAHPDINVYVCGNSAMALGTSNALAAAQKKDDVWVVTYDITNDGLERVLDGSLDCTIGKDSYAAGMREIEVATDLYFGTYDGPAYFMYDEQWAIDSTTIDDYLAQFPMEDR